MNHNCDCSEHLKFNVCQVFSYFVQTPQKLPNVYISWIHYAKPVVHSILLIQVTLYLSHQQAVFSQIILDLLHGVLAAVEHASSKSSVRSCLVKDLFKVRRDASAA